MTSNSAWVLIGFSAALASALPAFGNAAGFTLSAAPASVNLAPGGSVNATIRVAGTGGFTGKVTLTLPGLPPGVTGSFLPSAVGPGGTATLKLSAAGSAAAFSGRVTVTGASGSLTGTAPLNLTVPQSFTLSATPAFVALTAGSSATSTISVASPANFNGNVALIVSGLPSGVRVSFTPASIAPGGTVILKLTAALSAPAVFAKPTVIGVNGGLTTGVQLSLTVGLPPGFTLSATPASVAVTTGLSAASTIGVASIGGFGGSVALTIAGLPLGVTGSFAPASITSGKTAVLTVTAAASATMWAGKVTVIGVSGNLTGSLLLNLSVLAGPSFSLFVSPPSVTVMTGSSATTTVTVVPKGGFPGVVALGLNGLPAGVTATFVPPTIGPGSTSILTLSAADSATVTSCDLTLSGVNANLNSTTPIHLDMTAAPPSGFTLTTAFPSLLLPARGSVSTIVGVFPVGNFAGDVVLATTGLPCDVQAVFNPDTVPAGGTATLTLVSTQGSLVTTGIAITGTSGNLTASTPVSLTVTDPPGVKLIANPPFLDLPPGSMATTTIGILPAGGFSGSTTLLLKAPPGVTATVFPTTIAPGGTATLTLTASPSASLVTGPMVVMGGGGVARITLNNSTPGFTFEPPPSQQTLTGWLDTPLILDFSGGFSGDIQFAFSGLPSGVIGSFGPMVDCGGSNCRLLRFELVTGVTAAPALSTPVTITGTSGNLSSATTFNLDVAPASSFWVDPPMEIWPDSYRLTTPAGGTATATILGIGPAGNGFTVSVDGAPPTAIASLLAVPPSAYTMTIATTGQTAPGCYTLNVNGTAPGLDPPSTFAMYLTVTK